MDKSNRTAAEELERAQDPRPATIAEKLLTEGMLLVAVPAAAYVLSYAYEMGYAWHFDMPVAFIDVSANQFVRSAGYFLVIVAGIVVAAGIRRFIHPPGEPLWKRQVTAVIAVAVGVLLSAAFAPRRLWLPLLLITLLVGAAFVTWSLSVPPRVRRWVWEFTDWDDRARQTFRGLTSRFGMAVVLGGVGFVATAVMTVGFGWAMAVTKDTYLLAEGGSFDKEHVVLRMFGSKAVCAPWHERNRTVRKHFIVVDVIGPAEQPLLTFKREKTGPLKAVEPGDRSNLMHDDRRTTSQAHSPQGRRG